VVYIVLDTRQSAIAKAELIVVHDAEAQEFGAVVPPIAQTSLFTFESFAQMLDTFSGKRARNLYSRTTNPTVTLFEHKIAALEQAGDAIGFPSGMAAISGAVLGFVRPQDRIVCVRDVYPDAYRFFETLLKGLQVTIQYVDGADLRAVDAALEGAKILYLESPTSWTMRALDVSALAEIARRRGAISIIDNSWATPTIVHIRLGTQHLKAFATEGIAAGVNDTIGLAVAPADLKLFDPDSGLRMR
jgi:cystathionine beta-lyase/cystathionine gamma-synthase